MGIMETIRQRINRFLVGDEYLDRELQAMLMAREQSYSYYLGQQKRQMRVKPLQADDNLTTNYTHLVIDRSISLLLGGGVQFDLPGDEDSQEQLYIDSTYEANNGGVMLHRAAQYASLVGTGYIKIVPNGLTKFGREYHRLVPLDSRFMFVNTLPEDMDTVTSYVMRYNIVRDGEEVGRKEITEWNTVDGDTNQPLSWVIRNYEASKATGGRWEMVGDETVWEYPFPPIVHWANLPKPASVYGSSDIENVVELQDRINFVSSNISRIIRYHAHPKTWGRNVNLGNKVSWGGDEMVTVTGDGLIDNLEMQSDLQSSAEYLMNLRQSLFDITRTVDISSMSDKVGQLTNFGLRVLYSDALAKLKTKQSLMGEALLDLSYRLLVLNNFADPDPGVIMWPDNLPRNEKEDLEAAEIELRNGLVSKRTIATENNRDWTEEQERIAEESAAGDNIGAALLRAFNQGA